MRILNIINHLSVAALTSILLASVAHGKIRNHSVKTAEKPIQETLVVTLNNRVIIDDNVVRLGDLFNNAGPRADVTVAYAPAPGQRAVFDARWLYRIARAYRLGWRPFSRLTQSVVERDSQLISKNIIREEIISALDKKGLGDNVQVQLANGQSEFYIPGNIEPSIEIQDIHYQARTGHFTAIVAAPANDPSAQRVRISGRVYKVVELPVLSRRIRPGDTIDKGDIEWVQFRADRVQRSFIEDEHSLIGMSAKRSIQSGQPIRTNDIQRPLTIKKGDVVTMKLQSGLMSLTVQARALQSGARGDTIRVSNTKSNAVIDAIVISSGLVAVRDPSRSPNQVAMTREK